MTEATVDRIKHQVEEPNREPSRLRQSSSDSEQCCFCGTITWEGIYYRHDPSTLRCAGEHA